MEKYSHKDLIRVVDQAVDTLGIDKATMLFEGALSKATPVVRPEYRVRLLSDFLIGEAISLYGLEAQDFLFKTKPAEYKDARMICFHLVQKYTKSSYSMMERIFERKDRSIMHYCTETTERLQIPEFCKPFAERYRILEGRLLTFMATFEE